MKGCLQAQAEVARFDEGAVQQRRRSGLHDTNANNNDATNIVPHLKEKYDPEHPDADWGGYVQRSFKKKMYSSHVAARANLMADEKGGLMPDRLASTASTTSGKKMFDSTEVPVGDPLVPGIKFQSAVYQVGPGANISCGEWKTSYDSQTSMETTPKDTYAIGTKHNLQHKRHVTPMYEKSQLERKGSGRSSSPLLDNNSETMSRGSSPSGLSGSDSSRSLTSRRFEPRKSMLAGIGRLVAAEDVEDKLARPELHLPQGYLDPAKKVLITENHHTVTLGYTGQRKPSLRR